MSRGRVEPRIFAAGLKIRSASFPNEKRLPFGVFDPVPVPVPGTPVPGRPVPGVVPVPVSGSAPNEKLNCDQSKPREVFSFITTETSATCMVTSEALRPRRMRYGRIVSSARAPGATNETVPACNRSEEHTYELQS